MAISFYDASVGSYSQILAGIAGVMDKGAAYASTGEVTAEDIVATKLRDDMMSFHFQVVSTCHHSLGALQGMQQGRFTPPSFQEDKSYSDLQAMVSETLEGIRSIAKEDVEALADKSMVFALGERELPFTNENFLLTFSLPNFYFHATTTYDILRMRGVPLGKGDFLGQMRIG